jgi:hypothetical protein
MEPISLMRTDHAFHLFLLKYAAASLLLASGSLLLNSCATRPPTLPQPTAARVVANIEFDGANLTGVVSNLQLAGCWSMKLKISSDGPDAYDFLISTNGQENRIHIETCQQYTNAIQQGAYALTTADMAMESWFVRAVSALKFMETGQPSKHPLPDDFLTRLPVLLVGWNGSDEETQIHNDEKRGLTLKNYARKGRVTGLKQTNHTLHFQTEAKDIAVEAIACGDSDGDGFEDALVFVTWHYREGSGLGYAAYVVTKAADRPSMRLYSFWPR